MNKASKAIRGGLSWVKDKPILFGFLSMMMVMAVGFITLLVAVKPLQTKFSYDQTVFMPLKNVLCPGGLLRVPISGITSGDGNRN